MLSFLGSGFNLSPAGKGIFREDDLEAPHKRLKNEIAA